MGLHMDTGIMGGNMIENIDSVVVYRTKFLGDYRSLLTKTLPYLTKLFNEERDEYTSPVVSGGACTFFNHNTEGRELNKVEDFNELAGFIHKHYLKYMDITNQDSSKMMLAGMWANRYPTGAYARKHNHTMENDVADILFYLQKPEDSGDLYLEIDNIEYRIGVNEGDLIIFPGGYNHWTDPNKNQKDRLVIGVEYQLIGGFNDSRYY